MIHFGSAGNANRRSFMLADNTSIFIRYDGKMYRYTGTNLGSFTRNFSRVDYVLMPDSSVADILVFDVDGTEKIPMTTQAVVTTQIAWLRFNESALMVNGVLETRGRMWTSGVGNNTLFVAGEGVFPHATFTQNSQMNGYYFITSVMDGNTRRITSATRITNNVEAFAISADVNANYRIGAGAATGGLTYNFSGVPTTNGMAPTLPTSDFHSGTFMIAGHALVRFTANTHFYIRQDNNVRLPSDADTAFTRVAWAGAGFRIITDVNTGEVILLEVTTNQ
jgi:hypothetical protein